MLKLMLRRLRDWLRGYTDEDIRSLRNKLARYSLHGRFGEIVVLSKGEARAFHEGEHLIGGVESYATPPKTEGEQS